MAEWANPLEAKSYKQYVEGGQRTPYTVRSADQVLLKIDAEATPTRWRRVLLTVLYHLFTYLFGSSLKVV